MAKRKRHNPEKRAYKGKSYRKGGEPVRQLREQASPVTDSYCHRGKESDVYVYVSRRGIVCGNCRMIASDVPMESPLNMLTHLNGHILRGDKVPREALERLLRESGFTEDP